MVQKLHLGKKTNAIYKKSFIFYELEKTFITIFLIAVPILKLISDSRFQMFPEFDSSRCKK